MIVGGGQLSRASALNVDLDPAVGVRDRIWCWVEHTIAGDWLRTSTASTLSCDLSTSGAAGALDTGSVSADTVYLIYVITQDGGANPALLAVQSGSTPSMPSGYTYRSPPIWAVIVDSAGTDLIDWEQGAHGRCYLHGDSADLDAGVNAHGVRVSTTTSTSVQAVDCSAAVPGDGSGDSLCAEVLVYRRAENAANTGNAPKSTLYLDASGTQLIGTQLENIRDTAGERSRPELSEWLPAYGRQLTTLLYHQWDVSGIDNHQIWVAGWQMAGWVT